MRGSRIGFPARKFNRDAPLFSYRDMAPAFPRDELRLAKIQGIDIDRGLYCRGQVQLRGHGMP